MPMMRMVPAQRRMARLRLSAACLILAAPAAARCAEPGSSPDPKASRNPATCYRVDPSWPDRPDTFGVGHVPGIAVDDQDQIWVATRTVPPVQVYDTSGRLVRSWGEDTIKTAHQIRIDGRGHVWLADIGHHVVMEFTPEGSLLRTLGTRDRAGDDASHFDQPTDMAIAPDGEIYVADGYGNNRIVHFDADGRFVKEWGRLGDGPGEFRTPHAIVRDSAGRLYVADRGNARVQVFESDGRFVDEWRDLLVPWGLTITDDDQIWACGSSPMPAGLLNLAFGCPPRDQVFMRFDLDGKLRQLWTVPKGELGREEPGDCNWVHALAEDSQGNLYAGDIMGRRAQKFVRDE